MVLCLLEIWAWSILALGLGATAHSPIEPCRNPSSGYTSGLIFVPGFPSDSQHVDEFARTEAETETFEDEYEPAVDLPDSTAFFESRSDGAAPRPILLSAMASSCRAFSPPVIVAIPMRC